MATTFELNVLVSIVYVGGAVALILLFTVGLRPTPLTEDQRAEVMRLSQALLMLPFAPIDARPLPPPSP